MASEAVVTRFSRGNTTKTFASFNDSQRIYSDEHNLCTYSQNDNGRRIKFQVLDVPQRRWYEFNIPRDPSLPWPSLESLFEADETEWTNKFLQCIQNHKDYDTFTFNADNSITYEFKGSVGIPLRKQPILISSTFPIAQFPDITEKRYLYRAVDTCIWEGVRCVYKQLQFDSMIDTLDREIKTRETFMRYFGEKDPSSLSSRGINPILAIVVDGQPPLFYGILFALAGESLDRVSGQQITIQHFASLITTVMYLQKAGLEHGDICDRNVCIEGQSTQLIDFGEKAPDYTNDVIATGHLMRSCVDCGRVMEQEAEICEEAAVILVEKQDLQSALTVLRKPPVWKETR
jgi:hypothetical protein